MGTDSKSEVDGGKQNIFCLWMPMNLTLFTRCGQRQLWGLDTFSDNVFQLLPRWGSDSFSNNIFASLSLHPCTPGLAQKSTCDLLSFRHLMQKKNFSLGYLKTHKHDLVDLKHLELKCIKVWETDRMSEAPWLTHCTSQPPGSFSCWHLPFPLPGPFLFGILTEPTQRPENRVGILTGDHTPLRPVSIYVSMTLTIPLHTHVWTSPW